MPILIINKFDKDLIKNKVAIAEQHFSQCYMSMEPFGCIETKVCFFCVEVLRPSQPNEVMSSVVSLPNHTFTGQA